MAVASNSFDSLIGSAIREFIERAIEDEEERAVAAVREKIRAQKAVIAMAVMRNFDVTKHQDRIIITVRDTAGQS